MQVIFTSSYGLIVELDDAAGVRLVSSRGRVGPVLRSAAAIAKHTPYVDWVEGCGHIDLEAWLEEHDIEVSSLAVHEPSSTTE